MGFSEHLRSPHKEQQKLKEIHNYQTRQMKELLARGFPQFLGTSSVSVASCSSEYSAEGRHARHPGSGLPVLPASSLHGPDINLQGLPVLAPAGPGNHREEIRPQQHASGQSQGKKTQKSKLPHCREHQCGAVLRLFCLFWQGEVLFDSWMSIFSGNGGLFNPTTPIYSFDGRNVLTDSAW